VRPSVDRPVVSKPVTPPTARPETRPANRPSLPGLGGGNLANRPGINLPNRPGDGNRPGINLPNRPEGGRPNPGDIRDFLGMNRPVTLPANIGNRPGVGDRPTINWPNRPIGGNRPGTNWPKIGDINIGNKVINNRPVWSNIDNNRINIINKQWQNQIGGIQNWNRRYPDRMNYWNNWGNGVRNNWGHYGYHHNWFGPDWWYDHHHGFSGWHYYHGFQNHSWNYWWTIPTFASAVNWFNWTAPANVWTQPIFYDYGQGGNVVYQDNSVYINGKQVATADEFAQSAAALATVPPPANEEAAAKVEWMPLGTFAVASDQKDSNPTRALQLAVSREGIISGTLYNTQTDQAQTVQGQVDKETQRVAFRVGESEDIVVETGLYNLTQNDAPILVHFGKDKVENWLLVRLEQPKEEKQEQPKDEKKEQPKEEKKD
jgi:hypothetical protein